jgi:hypothetical protein
MKRVAISKPGLHTHTYITVASFLLHPEDGGRIFLLIVSELLPECAASYSGKQQAHSLLKNIELILFRLVPNSKYCYINTNAKWCVIMFIKFLSTSVQSTFSVVRVHKTIIKVW